MALKLSERPPKHDWNKKKESPQEQYERGLDELKREWRGFVNFLHFMGGAVLVVLLLILLAGCAATKHHPPQITDVSNADSLVRVSIYNARTGGVMGMLWPPEHEIQAKGEEGCQIFGKPAVRLGAKCMEYWQPDNKLFCKTAEILFACRTAD